MHRGITGIFQYALKDWTSIIFGTISHYEHNFHLFFEKKSTASIIYTFWYNFAVQKLSFIKHATNVFGPRSVLQADLSNEFIYLSVDIYLWWRPRVGCLLVEFLYLSDNELRTFSHLPVNEALRCFFFFFFFTKFKVKSEKHNFGIIFFC